MAETERPRITLITPSAFDLESYAGQLARLLDEVEIACLRLSLSSRDEDLIRRSADLCRSIAHERDVAIVIQDHLLMVDPLGLDGVHLGDGARGVRAARKQIGADAVIGAYCGASRHEGMTAGEAGADYAAFGPIGPSLLGKGQSAERGIFEWWSEIIELPCIAEGALTQGLIESFAPVTDFFAIGDEIWAAADPCAALKVLAAPIL